MAEDRIRVLRVIEYVGSRSFVERCLEGRTAKGRYYPGGLLRSSEFIQEAILGETAEVLSPAPKEIAISIEDLALLSELTREGTAWKPIDLLSAVSRIVNKLSPRDEDGVSSISGDINV